MTSKQRVLKNLADQIKILQDGYAQIEKLPDSIFDIMLPTQSANSVINDTVNSISTHINNLTEGIQNSTIVERAKEIATSDYGRNKKLVLRILLNTGHVMLKGDLLKIFEECLKSDKDETNTLTNALAALKADNSINGYKPAVGKVRGYYWGLSQWFDGDKLKEEFKPSEEQTLIPL